MIGVGILAAAVFMAFVGFCLRTAAKDATKQPQHYDGVGGKDTKNMLTAIFGFTVGVFCHIIAGILVVIGAIVAIIEHFM